VEKMRTTSRPLAKAMTIATGTWNVPRSARARRKVAVARTTSTIHVTP